MYIYSSNRLSSQSATGREQDEAVGAVYDCMSAVLSVLVFMASCVCIHTFCVYVCVLLLGTCAEPRCQLDLGAQIHGSLTSAGLLDLATPNADCGGQ